MGRPDGLTLPVVQEELFWGDAGIGMAIMGTTLAVAAIMGQGSGDQIGEFVPRCFGDKNDVKVAAFCSSEPGSGSDVSAIRTTAKYDEATDEWILNGSKAWATNRRHRRHPRRHRHRRPDARRSRPRCVRRADERDQGHQPGREGEEARSPRLAHRRREPRRRPRPRPLPARRQGEARRAPRPRS